MSSLKNMFGWTDPRSFYKDKDVYVNILHPPGHVTTDYTDVPTETLKNLWLARFGSRAVRLHYMYEIKDEQIAEVAQELMNRNKVSYQSEFKTDTEEKSTYYVLEKTSGDS